MARLTVRLAKRPDGNTVLTCVRPDGSSTWHKQKGPHAAFFPFHDLTHYAVETVLGHRRGFYGLVAEGWDFADFGSPWPRGPMPADADPTEWIVGCFDTERADGREARAAELNAKVDGMLGQHAIRGNWRPMQEADVVAIRAMVKDLFERWKALPPGEALELPFEVPAASSAHA